MAEIMSIEADLSKVQKALAGTNKSIPSIQKQTIGIIAKGAVKQIKAVVTATTQKHTGELQKAYRYKVRKDGSQANVYPKALNSDSTIFSKAMTLSYGHEGRTKRAAYWHIKALGFVQRGKSWIDSGAYEQNIDKMIEKELEKYWSS